MSGLKKVVILMTEEDLNLATKLAAQDTRSRATYIRLLVSNALKQAKNSSQYGSGHLGAGTFEPTPQPSPPANPGGFLAKLNKAREELALEGIASHTS